MFWAILGGVVLAVGITLACLILFKKPSND